MFAYTCAHACVGNVGGAPRVRRSADFYRTSLCIARPLRIPPPKELSMTAARILMLFATVLLCRPGLADESVPDDRTISFWVGEALREDPRVWVADIDVATRNGVVKLTGFVTTLMQRQYAAAIASRIRGVTHVDNRLEVATRPRPDSEIVADVSTRLKSSTGVRIQELRVTSRDAVVTVSGIVESAGYRAEALSMASEVSGVRAVQSGLKIRPTSQRTDREIANEIGTTFFRDVYLTGLDLNVQCRNGIVTLSGVVGNAYQKDRATRLAKNTANVVEVVNDITTNRLMERGGRRVAVAPTDDELKDAVEEQLASDHRIEASGIAVTTRNGHVSLRGHVPSMLQRQTAEVAARQVAGAVWVTNLLAVRTDVRPDIELQRAIKESLAQDSSLRGREFKVVVVDGVVSLSGVVTSYFPKIRAADVTSRVPGVRGIRNNIEVKWKSIFRDAALKEHVVTRLRANWETTYVVSLIDVTVTDGHVVLNGDVNTWAERREAGRMAFLTNGVRTVQNRLTIKGVKYPWENWSPDNGPEAPADWIHEYRGDFIERPGIIRL